MQIFLFKNINTNLIQDFVDGLHKSGMSRGSVVDYLSVIKFILKFGEKKYALKTNTSISDIEVPVTVKMIEEVKK